MENLSYRPASNKFRGNSILGKIEDSGSNKAEYLIVEISEPKTPHKFSTKQEFPKENIRVFVFDDSKSAFSELATDTDKKSEKLIPYLISLLWNKGYELGKKFWENKLDHDKVNLIKKIEISENNTIDWERLNGFNSEIVGYFFEKLNSSKDIVDFKLVWRDNGQKKMDEKMLKSLTCEIIKNHSNGVFVEKPEIEDKYGVDESSLNSMELSNDEFDIDEISELIEKGADLNTKNKKGYTKLHSAASEGCAEAVARLIDAGADVNEKNFMSRSPLYSAVENSHSKVIRELLEAGADVNIRDDYRITPLFLSETDEIVELLVKYDADVNANDEEGYRPIHYAVIRDQPKVVAALLDAGADCESESNTILPPISLSESEEIVSLLVKFGADTNFSDSEGHTPLFRVQEGSSVSKLIQNGADVSAENIYGNTPLHFASTGRKVELLIGAGAELEKKNMHGATPLHVAAMNDYADSVSALISAGARIDIEDKDGYTPIFRVRGKEVLNFLVNAGADINSKNKVGLTPLHNKAKNGQDNVINAMIELGADVNARDKYGFTPLHYAATNGHAIIVEILLGAGASVNVKDDSGRTPLSYAAENKHKKAIDNLLNGGAGYGKVLMEKLFSSVGNLFGRTHYTKEKSIVPSA